MRHVRDASTIELLEATAQVIDGLLRDLDAQLSKLQYQGNNQHFGDRSDTVTGYKGARVFLYTEQAHPRNPQAVINLEAHAPEPVLVSLTKRYSQYEAWARGNGYRVWRITR